MNIAVTIPPEFWQKMQSLIPKKEFRQFQQSCLQPLKKSIRINTLQISGAEFAALAKKKSWTLVPIPWCQEGFWIYRPEQEQKTMPLGKTAEHIMGLFYIQEASSMIPPEALFSQGETFQCVLDMAAAPGSKTTQIAAKMKNNHILLANEFSASRIKGLFSNIERCRVQNSCLTHFDGQFFEKAAPNMFDAILLDAPCTGEGTIRKDSLALQSWSPRNIALASGIQKKLLCSAFTALKPRGTLVYSTCTLSPEENEEVCLFLQEKFPQQVEFVSLKNLFPGAEKSCTPEGFLRIWPHVFDTEGFFIAKIRKKSSLGHTIPLSRKNKKKHSTFPFALISNTTFEIFYRYYLQRFGIDFSHLQKNLWQRNREIWFFPNHIQEFIGKIHFDRMGVKMCEIHEKNIKTHHQMATCFGKHFSQNIIPLSAEDAELYFAGKDLIAPQNSKLDCGEVLLNYSSFPIGLGKLTQEKIKNSLPRTLVQEGVVFYNSK